MASLTVAASAHTVILTPAAIATTSVFSSRTNVQMATRRRSRMVTMATAPKGSSTGPAINVGDKVAQGIEEAQQTCAGNESSEECAAAWDEVENLSATAADQKLKNKGKGDPLEEYCEDNPEADECRVYTD
jgi:hypothetical protein